MELEEIQSAYLENQFKVIVFSNPNNPTGVIYDGEFLQALDELAQNYGFYIIIDQSFSKVIFDFEKWQSSYFINSDKVFIVDSFSKNYLLQGARVAATLVPSDMEENFINIHQTAGDAENESKINDGTDVIKFDLDLNLNQSQQM